MQVGRLVPLGAALGWQPLRISKSPGLGLGPKGLGQRQPKAVVTRRAVVCPEKRDNVPPSHSREKGQQGVPISRLREMPKPRGNGARQGSEGTGRHSQWRSRCCARHNSHGSLRTSVRHRQGCTAKRKGEDTAEPQRDNVEPARPGMSLADDPKS